MNAALRGSRAASRPTSNASSNAVARAPHPAVPARHAAPTHGGGGSCSSATDTCSVSASPSWVTPARTVRAAAQPTEATVSVATDSDTTKWWKKDSDLWIDAHTEEDFRREISSGTKPVVVDFFATWCHGCQKSYPDICRSIRDPDVRKQFKFVKVCVDELKAVAKAEGITGLPRMHVYMPGHGLLVAMDVPASKVRYLRHNLNVIVGNPGMAFKLDPNGFVVPTGKLPPAGAVGTAADPRVSAAADKAREVERLQQGHSGLFEHLLKVAGVDRAGAKEQPAAAATNGRAASSAAALTSAPAAANGNAALAAAAAPLPPVGVNVMAYEQARAAFMAQHSSEYGYGGLIDALYQKEVGCRMQPNEHYMDYTGSSVYCQSQLDAVFSELRSCMFGNPHSANPSSAYTSTCVEEVRDMVLAHFNADPAEYLVVFTKSATDALKTVGETFPWSDKSLFRYLRENHNSVLGMREYALRAGGAFQAVNETYVDRWAMRGDTAGDHVVGRTADGEPSYSLFAYPAEDNFAGVKYPLSWVKAIQSRSTADHKWLVMLDAAAYVPTQPLDLKETPVDFVDMSFYKMFGYPTGVGALIVKTEVVPLLRKVFWGGGTVSLATSEDNFHVLKCKPSDKLEDGTVAFLDIIAIKHGLSMVQQLGGVKKIQSHVASLTEWLYGRLSKLRHSNGKPMMAIFGKHHMVNHRQVQGGILNFEVLAPDGSILSYKTFEREAAAAGFHVRTGAECNPGACYNYLGVKESEVESLAGTKEGCEDDVEFIKVQRPALTCAANGNANGNGAVQSSSELLRSIANSAIELGHPAEVAMKWVQVPLGSVRASLGWMSTFEDCYALADWVERTYKDREE